MWSSLRFEPSFFILALIVLAGTGSHFAFAAVEESVDVTDAPVRVNNYDLGVSNFVRAAQGGFDATGNYTPYPAGSESISNITNLSATYRFSQTWEGGLTLPIMESRTIFPTGSMFNTSISVPQLFGKVHLGTWAHITAHAGLSLPWRYRYGYVEGEPSASLPEDQGDLSMLSGFAVRTGVGASHTVQRFRFATDVSVTTPFPTSANESDAPIGTTGPSVQSGEQLLLSQGVAYTIDHAWSVNVGLREIWVGDTKTAGVVVDGTAGRVFNTNLGASYNPSMDWRWDASFSTQYPFYAYAVNQPYAPSVAISLTYSGGI